MSWNPDFLALLETPQNPSSMSYAVRTITVSGAPAAGAWQAATRSIPHHLRLVAGPPVISSQSVAIGTWATSEAVAQVPLVGDESSLRQVLRYLTRGTPLGVYAGPRGWAPGDWPRIFWGCLMDIQRRPGGLTLVIGGPMALMRSRITTNVTEVALFNSVGDSALLGGAYTVGDPTLTIAGGAVAQFERQASGVGVVKIVSAASSFDSFFLTWTGTSGSTLTGVSATAQYGTTASNATTADAASNIPLVYGHPMHMMLKVLLSTGTSGAHGSYDVLPEQWGFGLLEDLVDVADVEAWASNAVVVSSGSLVWDALVTEIPSYSATWLKDLLANGGIWPVLRQGRLTARAAQSPSGPPYQSTAVTLGDSDIQSWSGHRMFDASIPKQYAQHRVTTSSGSQVYSGQVTSLPCGKESTSDLSAVVWQNESAVATEVADRVGPWTTRVPERLKVTASMRMAQLCAGDVLPLTCPKVQLWGRYEAITGGYFEGRHSMIRGHRVDWANWRTELDLSLLPPFSGAFS